MDEVKQPEQSTTATPSASQPPVAPPVQQATPPSQPAQSSATEYPLAGNWGRFWASVTDNLIIGLPVGLVFVVYIFITQPDLTKRNTEDPFMIGLSIVALLVSYGYRLYFTVTKGATIGKDLYGFKVYKKEGNETISYKRSLGREVAKDLPSVVPFIGFLYVLANYLFILFTNLGIHDRIANTRVVKVGSVWPMKKQLPFFLILLLGIAVVAGGFVFYFQQRY